MEVDSKTMHRMHRIAGMRVAILRRVMPGRCRTQQTGADRRQRMANSRVGTLSKGLLMLWGSVFPSPLDDGAPIGTDMGWYRNRRSARG